MLWIPGNQFNWSVDNFGSTYSDSGLGTNSPGNASANAKGANTQMLAGIAEDCYGIAIGFCGGNSSATIRRNLVDLLVDHGAGVGGAGSSWSVKIANLYCAQAAIGCGGYWYYFPLYLPAGTAIGTANQSLTGSTSALRVLVKVFGKPTRPELLRVGTRVETFGAVTGSTTGTSITPGTTAMGAYTASLGTTANDLFWWQAGMGFNDTTLGAGASVSDGYWLDVAVSNGGTTKTVVAENIPLNFSTTEQGGKQWMGSRVPYWETPAGATVYCRAASLESPQGTPTCVAYGLGA